MRLNVLSSKAPWYADGVQFTCTQCGNCCTGAPGFVWITRQEIVRLAQLLRLSPQETVDRYCRKSAEQFSLRERRNAQGQYDCVFLQEAPGGKRVCGVYEARPLQCRTWPFWPGVLESRKAWDAAAVRCHGMNSGRRYSAEEIISLLDRQIAAPAAGWPGPETHTAPETR
jgi:Fe-S-cluster containining protein